MVKELNELAVRLANEAFIIGTDGAITANSHMILSYAESLIKVLSDKNSTCSMVLVDKDKLEELEADSKFLDRLRANGVDNWDGYEFALEDED